MTSDHDTSDLSDTNQGHVLLGNSLLNHLANCIIDFCLRLQKTRNKNIWEEFPHYNPSWYLRPFSLDDFHQPNLIAHLIPDDSPEKPIPGCQGAFLTSHRQSRSKSPGSTGGDHYATIVDRIWQCWDGWPDFWTIKSMWQVGLIGITALPVEQVVRRARQQCSTNQSPSYPRSDCKSKFGRSQL